MAQLKDLKNMEIGEKLLFDQEEMKKDNSDSSTEEMERNNALMD